MIPCKLPDDDFYPGATAALKETQMAQTQSFDVTSSVDLQEVDNAVNQARREITGRFDFKGVPVEIEFNRAENSISIHTSDQFKLDAVWQVLLQRLIARQVPVKNLKREDPQRAAGDTVRQEVKLVQGIDGDTAKRITQFIRDQKLKNVKAQVQGDAVRVSAPSRDTLQTVIRALRDEEWDVELQFGNYR